MVKRIAFIKMGSFSNSTNNIVKEFRTNFPEYEIDVIDIWEDVVYKYHFFNVLFVLLTYNWQLLQHEKTFFGALLRNSYFFKIVRRKLQRRLSGKDYCFTIQLQSIFDAHIPGIPHFIYTDHTHLAAKLYPTFKKDELYAKSWIENEKQIYEYATAIFTMGSQVKHSLISHYNINDSKIYVAGAGYNISSKGQAEMEENLKRYSNKTILFIGKEWERKGGPELYAAFLEVKKQIPDAKLVIIGCKPFVDENICEVLDYLPIEELEKHYFNSSVFCTPSKKEPFGFVFLEAYAHRLPVVVKNIGALPDFVEEGKTGFLTNSQADLVDKLILLLNNADMAKSFGEKGYEKITNYYTWELTVKRISDRIKISLESY